MAAPKTLPNSKPAIVIKRPKKVVGGHHGGNWKVAYADFMTAMMAFFLLLWILSVSDSEKLEGIADYFTPASIPLVDISGYDPLAPPSRQPLPDSPDQAEPTEMPNAAEEADLTDPPTEASTGGVLNPWSALDERNEIARAIGTGTMTMPEQIAAAEAALEDAMAQGNPLESLAGNLMVSRAQDGLVVEIIDLGERPMFESGSAALTDDICRILGELRDILAEVPMLVSITGHTDARPYRGDGPYGNWELSTDRANATRRALEALGVPPGRFKGISGLAAVAPLVPEDPSDARNRRITIELLAVEG